MVGKWNSKAVFLVLLALGLLGLEVYGFVDSFVHDDGRHRRTLGGVRSHNN
jgi:hypothetical protein